MSRPVTHTLRPTHLRGRQNLPAQRPRWDRGQRTVCSECPQPANQAASNRGGRLRPPVLLCANWSLWIHERPGRLTGPPGHASGAVLSLRLCSGLPIVPPRRSPGLARETERIYSLPVWWVGRATRVMPRSDGVWQAARSAECAPLSAHGGGGWGGGWEGGAAEL